MNWIIAGLVISGLIAVAVVAIRNKRKSDKKLANVKFPKIDKEERTVLNAVENITGQSHPYWVVRDKNDHIPLLGMSLYEWATTVRGLKNAPFGAVIHNTVYINRDTPYPDIQHFGRTAIHELNHVAGDMHGEDMEKKDASMYKELKEAMGWK